MLNFLKKFKINRIFQKNIRFSNNLFYFMQKETNNQISTNENKEPKQPKENKKPKKNKEIALDNDKALDHKDKGAVQAPKGTRDFLPFQMAIRNKAFKIITGVFRKHGAVEIDTPVFELKETLMGKYGEDSKLIYDLQDQGGQLLSLRYDLTVPFARFMACHPFPSIKRFHIGKVYRRDQPQISKGRFREFYQCDLDIAGPNYGKMIPDAEILKVVVEILTSFNFDNFLIKINHRKLLDATIELSGIPDTKFKTVCSSVDKLDKEAPKEIKHELLEKGLTEEQIDKLFSYVELRDEPPKLYEKLVSDNELLQNQKAKEALEDMKILIDYIEIYEITKFISFDLSLARGLDYYTGLIYEAVLTTGDKIGSIAGGGRYDDLLGMFSGKQIPSVGMSIGLERIFAILEEKYSNIRAIETEVLVASIGKNMTKERLRVLNELWKNEIKAETLYNENPRNDKQMDFATNNKVPFVIFIGENEVKENKIKVKCMNTHKETVLERDSFVDPLKEMIAEYYQNLV